MFRQSTYMNDPNSVLANALLHIAICEAVGEIVLCWGGCWGVLVTTVHVHLRRPRRGPWRERGRRRVAALVAVVAPRPMLLEQRSFLQQGGCGKFESAFCRGSSGRGSSTIQRRGTRERRQQVVHKLGTVGKIDPDTFPRSILSQSGLLLNKDKRHATSR